MSSFVDIVRIQCKAGDGGDGAVSFHREKYVPDGGPDGGDGGRGGNIVFVGTQNMHTLMDFRYKRKYEAASGEKGGANLCSGKMGADLVIEVPVGTLVKDARGLVLADVSQPGEARVLLRGGRGGWGNNHFKTATRQAPNFAKPGERTKWTELTLELKSIADVGLVGFPNVGKSTLLSVCSAAKPKIANYPFTTLLPNLGVVRPDRGTDGFVMADIPGLVEGASEGVGLGHDFLRHVERTRLLVHVLDMAGADGRDPLDDYAVIQKELQNYGRLAASPQIVAANKMDLPEAADNLARFREAHPDVEVFEISAATTQGVQALVWEIARRLVDIPMPESFEDEVQPLPEATEPFTISRDGDAYRVEGDSIERLLRSTNLEDDASLAWFERTLRRWGVIDALREAGATEGDTVVLCDLEFDFVD